MSPKLYGRLVSLLAVFSVLVGFGGCRHSIAVNTRPVPLARNKCIRGPFYVVGVDKAGEPRLLKHEVGLQNGRGCYKSEAEFRKAMGAEALWSEGCRNNSNYSFYIDPRSREDIQRTLTSMQGDTSRGVTIKLLENHPSAKSQKIYIDYWNDDYSYYSVYSVQGHSLTPLEFGDFTRGDSFQGLMIGFEYMLIAYVVGRIALAIAARCARAPSPHPSPPGEGAA